MNRRVAFVLLTVLVVFVIPGVKPHEAVMGSGRMVGRERERERHQMRPMQREEMLEEEMGRIRREEILEEEMGRIRREEMLEEEMGRIRREEMLEEMDRIRMEGGRLREERTGYRRY